MIFQEPMTSLNPVFTVGEQIVEAVTLHQHVGRKQAFEIAEKSMRDVGIADPHRRLHDYPHQMSGGMRQRVMIAMALSCQPKLLIADEPTTALDVTIQAQILELLRSLQQERGMAILLITHDLGVVAENADVAAVMYASRIVEHANVEQLFDNPQHPYTQGLFRAVPKLGAKASRLEAIPGMVPNPGKFPPGCKFHPRCAVAAARAAAGQKDQTVEVRIDTGSVSVSVPKLCNATEPDLREVSPEHWAACHFVDGFTQAKPTVPRSAFKRADVAGAGEVQSSTTAGGAR
jgi:oligopeptide/dipeptide ABC transporter ATP-binding protein